MKSAIPSPAGLSYRDYQLTGIEYMQLHAGTLLADDPGLGKTIQVAGYINSDSSLREVLIGCPPSLAINWKKELEKWLVTDHTIGIAKGDFFPATDIIILPYSIAWRHRHRIRLWLWDLMVLDEAHECKNPEAKRSLSFINKQNPVRSRRAVFVTGTPIENRPIEIHNLVSYLNPKRFKGRHEFGMRYCEPRRVKKGMKGWDWIYTGADNLPELHQKLDGVMIRRRKKDVLKELPPKVRSVIRLDGFERVKEEAELLFEARERIEELKAEYHEAQANDMIDAMAEIQTFIEYELHEMAEIRHETALIKLDKSYPYIDALLRDHEKIIIFAWHRDVIEELQDHYKEMCVVHHGGRNAQQKEEAVQAFQEDKNTRIFIGNIKSAGVGLTLTAASVVLFMELDWSPKKLEQAEDRAHRIGQNDNVLVYYLVLEGSIDASMASTLVDKLNVIDQAIEGEETSMQASDWADVLFTSV